MRMKTGIRTTFLLVVLGLAMAFGAPAWAQDRVGLSQVVWLEGESPGTCNIPFKPAGAEASEFLSGKQWLLISIPDNDVAKGVPDEGIRIVYEFDLTRAGSQDVWLRLGFESVRSAFDWRVDQNPWQTVTPEALTTDLMRLGFWTEVAWLKLGTQDLASGKHHIEFKIDRQKTDEGKPIRVMFAADVICVAGQDSFQPHAGNKAGEPWQTATDQAAAQHVFDLGPANPGQRSDVSLAGLWEVCRHDEQTPGAVDVPIQDMPDSPIWSGIKIPSDKNVSRPDLMFAHRLWFRARVNVPASLKGRAFSLDFPCNNLNTTVVVNGVPCGFEKNPFVRFQMDVTEGVKPGQVNEIWVGIRDAWYGRSADPNRPMKLRKTFNLPIELFNRGFQDMDYPVWNCPQSGLLSTPTLIAAGHGVYVSDVFVKPRLDIKQLQAEVTVSNTGDQSVAGLLQWQAVNIETGRAEKIFKAFPFQVAAGQSKVLDMAGAWPDPKLWWPDTPHLYELRTQVEINGRVADVKDTRFGFRQWQIQGTQFTLNGVVWHMWADLIGSKSTPEEWLEAYRDTGQRTMRLSTAGQAGPETRWMGLEPHKALEFFDKHGVVVRRNTTLDGEVIGYHFSEGDPETRKQQGGSELKLALMKNWRDQCVAQVRGERNHPSIQIWTLENEFAYINLINLLGNSKNMDLYEAEITKAHDAVMAVDPTRSVMIDGGGALRDNSLGVHGDHYLATLDLRYPDLAYEPFVQGGGRGRWIWDQTRPRFAGEDFFATGKNPADYALWGGEIAFQGKAATRDAIARIYRMLNEGYRWGGYYAAWHFWLGTDGGPAQWGANAARAVFVRELDWTFGAGQTVTRTFGLFNDTQYTEPMTFTRTLKIQGRTCYTKTTTHVVAPGQAEKFEEIMVMPGVVTREEGTLELILKVGDREVYRDTKAVSVLPSPKALSCKVAVYDPAGQAQAFLKASGVTCQGVASLNNLPSETKVLVVGSDAIGRAASTSTALAVYASKGHAVIVLDQSEPLKYQAVPAEMDLAPVSRKNDFGTEVPTAQGSTAYIEDTSHPALSGLQDKDFFTWGPGQHVYRHVYTKPTRGAKSLVQTGPRLAYSALVEVPVGKGVMYLSQMDMGRRLGAHAVAGQVLRNLVQCALAYKLEYAPVAACVQEAPLIQTMTAIGLQYSVSDALDTIKDPQVKIALVSATTANLRTLVQHMSEVKAFWQRGGTLMLLGLTAEGLADYNKIVGVTHAIRPFRRERVTFPPVRHPLMAGLTVGDIVMLSGERIFGWTADEYVSSDVFTHVVDLDDVAPFAKSDFGNYANIVNGFVSSDGWPLIIDFEYPKDGSPYNIRMDLPTEQTLVEFTFDPSVNYNPTTQIGLLFDGKDSAEYELEPTGDPQTFAIEPPRRAKEVTLQLKAWLKDPTKRPIIGIDNIVLESQRSQDWLDTVRPMLNVGGLVHYAKGSGGVVLVNLKFQETEQVPINQIKKRTILSAVLRNLKAPFSGARTVIAGADLKYTPFDIHTRATTYKDERGWFGDKNRTFKSLASGEQVFGGVPYLIYDMPTSPVPQVLMLKGSKLSGNLPDQIQGIPIKAKVDALFFLHTARIDRRASERDLRDKKRFELLTYVVNYEDGQTENVPIFQGQDIDHYIQRRPESLPGASLAWTSAYENSDERTAAYAKQWNNPRPDVQIESVDMVYGKDKDCGVPVLIAITGAAAR